MANTISTPSINLSELEDSKLSELEHTGYQMKVGDSKTFSVSGNPTTGYTWNLNQDDASDSTISIKKTYKTKSAPRD